MNTRNLVLITSACAAIAACGSSSSKGTSSGAGAATSSGSTSSGSTSSAGGSTASSTSSTGGGSNATSTSTSSASGTSSTSGGPTATWTAVDLLNDSENGTTIMHQGNSIVSAIWFKDTSHGVVTLYGSNQTATQAGAVEHLSSPTVVDKIAVSGVGAGDGQQDVDFLTLFPTPLGIATGDSFGDLTWVSSDGGSTFTMLKTSATSTPNASQVFLGADSSGVWHELDDIGNVWSSPTAPSATATWTRTWNPEASPPDPDPVPAADCQFTFHQGYYAREAQRVFTMSPDGQTMMYPAGLQENPVGVCRSTDGGHNFVPVAFPNVATAASEGEPFVILMTSATHGIAASSDNNTDGSAFVYTTDDAGATWTAGTLPASVNAPGAAAAIVSGFAAPDGQHIWLIGMTLVSDAQALLLKSSDGGATWKDISGALSAIPAAASKMHSGFALDANNIWVGGDNGALIYSPTGGE